MNSLMQDLRFAARQLRKSPGFAVTVILTLGLGIGVTTAVYSVIQAVLLEPLPYPEPGRLVGVAYSFPHEVPNAEQTGVAADFVEAHARAFSSVAVMDDSGAQVNVSVAGGHAEVMSALHVSEGYFRTFGVAPELGRGFLPQEDRPGGGKVVVLSDGLWKRLFRSDPSVLGRVVRINQENFTVVGVMPASFRAIAETAPGVLGTPDVWEPLQLGPEYPGYDGDNFEMIARLRPGVTLEQAQQELGALTDPFYQLNPRARQWVSSGHEVHEFRAWPLQDVVVGDVRRSMMTMMGAVIAVLLLACLNIAGLMMSRAMRRSREMALRQAIGATRVRMLRLLASEGLLLALGGGLLAVFVARVGAWILLHAAPLAIPALRGEPGIGLVSAVVLLIALATMGIFSVLPGWWMLRRQAGEMRLGGPSLGETISHARLSRVLIVAQVALAMVLVSTASILLGTLVKLRATPTGIVPKRLTVFQVALRGERYASTRQTTQFVATVLDGLRDEPGVDSVAAVNGLPLDRGLNDGGSPQDRPDLERTVEFRAVTPGYFRTMGIPLLAGRDFATSDDAGSVPVVLISATTAKKWWPDRSPIGELIRVGRDQNRRVIGVVADVRMSSLTESSPIVIYGAMAQLTDAFTGMMNGWFRTSFAVRTAADVSLAGAVQQAVAKADPEIPVTRLSSMQAVIDDTIQEPEFFSVVAAGFSAFAVLLMAIGLFGMQSYQVSQRTREIGVRMALGADRSRILGVFLRRGVVVALVGIVVGLAACWWIQPVVMHLLSDSGVDIPVDAARGAATVVMNATEAAMLAAVAMLIAAFLASLLPARRAAAVEPMQALRNE